MASTAYGDHEIVQAGKVHGTHHVGDARTADDEIGAPVDHRIVDLAGGIIAVVTGTDQPTAQIGLELGDRRFVRSFAVMSCHASLLKFGLQIIPDAGSAHAINAFAP